MTTKTREQLKPNVGTIHKDTDQLRTVNDIIEFYTNRKS